VLRVSRNQSSGAQNAELKLTPKSITVFRLASPRRVKSCGYVRYALLTDIRRAWAMPNLETFSVTPIGELVQRYLRRATVSIDPFARNKRWATYTNDLNPTTEAEYHMEVVDYLNLLTERGVKADLFLFDPPYSPRQIKECYSSIGKTMTTADGQSARLKKLWRQAALPLLTDDAIVISCGWNSVGFGVMLGFELIEVLLVCHGGDHNDTIVTVERKTAASQSDLFQ